MSESGDLEIVASDETVISLAAGCGLSFNVERLRSPNARQLGGLGLAQQRLRHDVESSMSVRFMMHEDRSLEVVCRDCCGSGAIIPRAAVGRGLDTGGYRLIQHKLPALIR